MIGDILRASRESQPQQKDETDSDAIKAILTFVTLFYLCVCVLLAVCSVVSYQAGYAKGMQDQLKSFIKQGLK